MQTGYVQTSRYISQTLQKTDEMRYKLERILYNMSGIAYRKGSRKGDYDIRDRVQNLVREVNQYTSNIRFFENAKNGDHKAYEDILIFFQNNYFDYCTIDQRLDELHEVIAHQEEVDDEHNRKHNSPEMQRMSNVYLGTLKTEIDSITFIFNNKVRAGLNEFLTNINQLYYYFSLQNGLHPKPPSSQHYEDNREKIERYSFTFLWIEFKISGKFLSIRRCLEHLEQILDTMGITQTVLHSSGYNRLRFSELLSSIVTSFHEMLSDTQKEEENLVEEEEQYFEHSHDENTEYRQKVKTLIEDLTYINTTTKQQRSSSIDQDGIVTKDQRYLFNTKGSYDLSLMTVCDYHTNSMLFIFSWIYQEISHNRLQYIYLKPLLEATDTCNNFYTLYKTALITSNIEENQKKTFSGGKIYTYISKDLGHRILKSITESCQELDEAFVTCLINFESHNSIVSEKSAKKLKIVQDSYSDSRHRIMQHLREFT